MTTSAARASPVSSRRRDRATRKAPIRLITANSPPTLTSLRTRPLRLVRTDAAVPNPSRGTTDEPNITRCRRRLRRLIAASALWLRTEYLDSTLLGPSWKWHEDGMLAEATDRQSQRRLLHGRFTDCAVRIKRCVFAGQPCARVVVRGGVEPPTFRFSGGRSYQLSYLTGLAAGRSLTARGSRQN
jgi:hypothetical protein